MISPFPGRGAARSAAKWCVADPDRHEHRVREGPRSAVHRIRETCCRHRIQACLLIRHHYDSRIIARRAAAATAAIRSPRRRSSLRPAARRPRPRSACRRARSRAISTSTGAVKTPSASPPWISRRLAGRGRALTPNEKLRDCGLEQVSSRSPRPDRPIMVSGLAPIGLAETDQFGEAARGQRRRGAGAEPAAGDDAGGDGEHVLRRAADLDAAHVGRNDRAGSSPSRSPAPASRGELVVARRQRHRGRQAARHVGGEARSGQDRRRRAAARIRRRSRS